MMHFFLGPFLSESECQQHSYDGAAKVALPGDVLWPGQGGDHSPDETAVEKYHDKRDDDEHAVAADETAHDEEEIERVDEPAGTHVDGVGVADAPGEEAAAEPADKHDAVGQGGVTVIQRCA